MAKAPFQDPDLHTPAHDAIMMWLEENAQTLMQERIENIHTQSRLDVEEAISKTKLNVVALDGCQALLDGAAPHVDVESTWEVPTRFSGGMRYIDMLLVANFEMLRSDDDSDGRRIDVELTGRIEELRRLGYSVDRNGGGYGTVLMVRKAHIVSKTLYAVGVACEVKPVIRSVGELIRQLRQYENFSLSESVCASATNRQKRYVAVVSPDDRFRAIIEKQGFIFIKAPQPEYGPQGGLF